MLNHTNVIEQIESHTRYFVASTASIVVHCNWYTDDVPIRGVIFDPSRPLSAQTFMLASLQRV
jgi:hypothetical protein